MNTPFLPSLTLFALCYLPISAVAHDTPAHNESAGEQARERLEIEKQIEAARQKRERELSRVIDAITLAENPSRKDYIAYVRALREQAQAMWEIDGPFAPFDAKMQAVPAEHVDLVLAEYAMDTRLFVAAKQTLLALNLDDETLKQRVIDNLASNPDNIGLVVRNGWCEAVKPVIIDKVLKAEDGLDDAWFYAAVEITEPKLYAKLHKLTVDMKEPFTRLELLTALPDYDLANTVNTIWLRERKSPQLEIRDQYGTPNNFNKDELANLAAGNGSIDAMGWLIERLPDSYDFTNAYPNTVNTSRLYVIRYIDFRGDNRQIKAWFKANRDKLVFDQFRKRFVVQGVEQ